MTTANLIRMAYARLEGLRASFDQAKTAKSRSLASQSFIEDFHDIITDLETLKVDLSKFRVPEEARTEYSSPFGFACELDYLVSKINGLLNLFTVTKQNIGFIDNH